MTARARENFAERFDKRREFAIFVRIRRKCQAIRDTVFYFGNIANRVSVDRMDYNNYVPFRALHCFCNDASRVSRIETVTENYGIREDRK